MDDNQYNGMMNPEYLHLKRRQHYNGKKTTTLVVQHRIVSATLSFFFENNGMKKNKKGGRTWVYIDVPEQAKNEIRKCFKDELKDEWQCDLYGLDFKDSKREKPLSEKENLHITFLNAIDDDEENVNRFKKFISEKESFEVSLGSIFFTEVDRIKPRTVYALGLPVVDENDNIKKIRQDLLSNHKQIKGTRVAYADNPGHVSCAYIIKEHKDEAEKCVNKINLELSQNNPKRFTWRVESVVLYYGGSGKKQPCYFKTTK